MTFDASFGELHKLFDDNFMDYTAYVVKERAIPHIVDGLKPVQRRILQTLHNMDDGRFNKVANVVGETMKLHPHGDASIFAALVNLANKGFLIDRQGNFGNLYTGDQASAARYIECRLSPLALEVLFNKDLTEHIDSYDGRMQEPVVLPAKIPLLLMQGAEGIAVGMATKIMPHNFVELLSAQQAILRGQEFQLFPDFYQGGMIDVSAYGDGNGRIRCRARIVEKDDKTITVTEIPYGTTTQSLIESVEKAVRAGKLKITSINDYTAEQVEIEINLARGVHAKDTVRALYAFTDCEVPISPNLTVIAEDRPVNISVSEVLRYNTKKLVVDLERELTIELGRLREKLHAHLLEQIFIEERLYKQIEECPSYGLVIQTVDHSLQPFRERLLRPVTVEDIERLLEIKIKRISRYDINKKQKEIDEVRSKTKQVEKHLRDMVKFTVDYLGDLLKRYGKEYGRRTEITTFSEVVARTVALSNLTCGYDPTTGFVGCQVKGEPERSFSCSEYDKFLLIFKDGIYKVINVVDKLFVGPDLEYVGKIKEKTIFNIIYRDGQENLSYIKRFETPKFILDKEYRLFEEDSKSRIQYLSLGDEARVRVVLVPVARAKSNAVAVVFKDFLVKGAAAKGKRVANRGVRRIVPLTDKETLTEPEPQPPLPGL